MGVVYWTEPFSRISIVVRESVVDCTMLPEGKRTFTFTGLSCCPSPKCATSGFWLPLLPAWTFAHAARFTSGNSDLYAGNNVESAPHLITSVIPLEQFSLSIGRFSNASLQPRAQSSTLLGLTLFQTSVTLVGGS